MYEPRKETETDWNCPLLLCHAPWRTHQTFSSRSNQALPTNTCTEHPFCTAVVRTNRQFAYWENTKATPASRLRESIQIVSSWEVFKWHNPHHLCRLGRRDPGAQLLKTISNCLSWQRVIFTRSMSIFADFAWVLCLSWEILSVYLYPAKERNRSYVDGGALCCACKRLGGGVGWHWWNSRLTLRAADPSLLDEPAGAYHHCRPKYRQRHISTKCQRTADNTHFTPSGHLSSTSAISVLVTWLIKLHPVTWPK